MCPNERILTNNTRLI